MVAHTSQNTAIVVSSNGASTPSMSGCSGPISSVWSGASLYPRLNPEDNCWTFAALTKSCVMPLALAIRAI